MNPTGKINTSALWVKLTALTCFTCGAYTVAVTSALREEKGVKREVGSGEQEKKI